MKTLKTALILTALLSGMAQAQTPKCADSDELCWQQAASAEWRNTYGDMSPPLTAEAEKEVRAWLAKHYPNTNFSNP